jgi:hypothetical protein
LTILTVPISQHAVELLLDKTRQPTAQFLRQIHAAR